MKTSTLIVILFCTTQEYSVYALTWDDVRSTALTHNQPLRAADLDVERAAAGVRSASSGFLPSLKATYSKTKTIDPAPVGSSISNRAGLSASQNLFAGLADAAAYHRAKASKSATEASRRAASVEQRSILRKLFDLGLYLQDAKSYAARTIARRNENVRIVNLRYEGGRENKSSVLKTEAAKMQAEADHTYFSSSLDLTRAELANAIGQPVPSSEAFSGTLERDVSAPNASPAPHPRLTKAEAERESTAAAVKEARAGWFPSLTADASVYRSGSDSELKPDNHIAVGMTLTVPLFTPSQHPQYRDATLQLSKQDVELATLRQSMDLDLKKAQLAASDAKSRVAVASKIMEASRLQAEVYRKRYTLGLISFQDWDAAEAEYIKADKDLLAARHNLADAVTTLDAALGRTLEETL